MLRRRDLLLSGPFALGACATIPAMNTVKCTQFIRGLVDAARVQRLPGITGLVVNETIRARSPETEYDAALEIWFESETAYSNAHAALAPDALTLITREAPIRVQPPGRPAPRAKRIGLVGRRPDMPREIFFRDWRDVHAPPVDLQPGLERYILNFLENEAPPWDGYAALWWTDWDAFEHARQFIRTQGDLNQRLGFFDAHELLYVEEHVLIEPPVIAPT